MTSDTAALASPAGNSRKAREFARREREILNTALHCFSSADWESVTVAHIAEMVGIAKGTMYLHFSSKHEIYARLTLDFYRSLLDHLTDVAQSSTHDHLKQMIEQAFSFYLNQPKYRCVTQYCEREDFRSNLSDELAAQFDAVDQAFHQLIESELQRGIATGCYRSVDTNQAILGLQCTFHGALTLLWCNRHGEQDDAEQFINNITQYMLTPLTVVQPHQAASASLSSVDHGHQLETTHE